MTKEQNNLSLYKTFHKLLLARVNGGDIIALPIYNTISYTVWCYEHVFKLEVLGVLSGKDVDIYSTCPPLSVVDSMDVLMESCYGKFSNTLNLAYVATPNIPPLLPEELLYDVDGKDNFIKLFPEDIAVMLKTRFGSIEDINNEFFNILKALLDGKHIVHNINDFSYFQTFILRLALTGGVNDLLMSYSKVRGRYIKSTLPNVRAIIGKDKRHSVTKYISRSSYLSRLRDECKVIEKQRGKGDINIQDYTEYEIPKAMRDFYESQIAPYLYNLKRKNNE